MLSQLDRLSVQADGRYATDTELQFLADYVQSFNVRVQTYLRLQELESTIVQQAYVKIRAVDPRLLHYGYEDVSTKWKRDTIRVIRYTAIAVLINDPDALKERFLLWFQTIMQAFSAQRGCEVTYQVLQDVVRQYLTPAQANLVCPMLELNRRMLGSKSLNA